MKLWRLYVGLPTYVKGMERITSIVLLHLAGASISYGAGIWKGVVEHNAVIEVIQDSIQDYMLEESLVPLINHLKAELKQESIYVVCLPLEKAYLL